MRYKPGGENGDGILVQEVLLEIEQSNVNSILISGVTIKPGFRAGGTLSRFHGTAFLQL